MKKKITLLLTVFALCCTAFLAACGNTKHKHTYASEWTYDEATHWHAATCEHTEEKSGVAAHDFDGGAETADGKTKFTCAECGYSYENPSRYRVTAEEYASILGGVDNFKLSVTGDSSANYILSDVVYRGDYFAQKYFLYDGTTYYVIEKDDSGMWVKNKSSKETYEYEKEERMYYLTELKNVFSSLSYNAETKTYEAASVHVSNDYDEFYFKNVSISFKDKKVTAISFTEEHDNGEYKSRYVYSDIGSATAELPAVHEHTYSEEWSYNEENHWHASTCTHEHAEEKKSDFGAHVFDGGVETSKGVEYACVCGYKKYGPSRYMVTAEEYASILGAVDNFKLSVTGDSSADYILSDVVYRGDYFAQKYFLYDGTTYYVIEKDDSGMWVKNESSKETYEYEKEERMYYLTELKNVFSSLSYNAETKTYEAASVHVSNDYDEFYFKNISISFKDKKVTAISFTEEHDIGEYKSRYVYSDIGSATAELPAVHEHTYSEEWSYNEETHWHASTCTHEHAEEKKSGLADHVFTTEEVENGTKYTCSVCGYSEVRKSIYMVTEEEFESILNSAKKFKLVASGESGYTVILGDVSYFEDSYRTRYYLFEGDKYYQVFQEMNNEWIKEEIEKSQYDYALSGYGILDALSEYYSDLVYDAETKSYKANNIGISPVGGGLVTTYYDMTVSFENKALKSVTYYLYLNYGRVRQDFEYSDIGTANAELPAIHEHTFAEEWSYDYQNHWHSSNCSHIYERSDEGEHMFEKGVCTVCEYNVLNISEDGKILYGIQYGFDEDYDFNTFIIPNSIITISSGAFKNYTKLTELDIPEGVTVIEEYAFYGCTGLTRILLPNTLTSIGENAFANCSALKEIIIPKSVTEFDLSAFTDCSVSIYYKGSKSDWEKMTEGADVLGEVTLNFYSETNPADIGNFWYYDENGKITLWDAHTFEDKWTYDETNHWRVATCEHTDIKGMFGPHTFDDGVVDGDRMKFTCTACGYLKTEESPYLVTEEEFKNILNSVNIFKVKVSNAENFTAILNDVRYYESEDSMIYYTFENGEYYVISKDGDQWVKDETAKESYDSISNYNLFSAFSELFSEFTFDLKTMSYYAYHIQITDEGGYTVFYYEVSVSFENNAVTSLAFKISNYQLNFKYSEIGTASKDLPADIHEHTFNEEWWWDDSTHCHYATCEHGNATKDSGFHTFEKGICTECGFNVLIVSKDGTTVTGITDARDEEGYRLEYNGFTIPEGVTTIGKKLFYENKDITEIVIPEGVTAIEEYAFAYCSNLTRVTLPSTLKTMASHTFVWCRKLNGVVLPSDLTSMESNCFDGCYALTEITIPSGITIINDEMFFECTSLKTVNLPDTVTTLGFQAFYGCIALTEIVIPDSVTEFKQAAFWKSAISKIYYGGTKAEYDKISGLNYISDSVTVYFYSEEEPTETGNFWHYVDGEPVKW